MNEKEKKEVTSSRLPTHNFPVLHQLINWPSIKDKAEASELVGQERAQAPHFVRSPATTERQRELRNL
jgi:hypothetical protein